MSLINEALRRARLEAARQEAARHGDPPPVLPTALPDRKRFPWRHFVLALIVGVVLAGTIFWLAGWSRRAQTASAVPATKAAPATGRLGPPAPINSGRTRPAAPQTVNPRRVPAPPPHPKAAAKSEAAKRPAGPLPVDQAQPRHRGAGPATASHHAPTAPARPEESLVDGFTYVASIDAAGRHLALSGIAWSSSHPTAVLNDAAVSQGDEVAGFRVIKVEPDRVELQADGKTVFLRLP